MEAHPAPAAGTTPQTPLAENIQMFLSKCLPGGATTPMVTMVRVIASADHD